MKHLKTFENISKGPQVGDYVVCETDQEKVYAQFVRSNVGLITRIIFLSSYPYEIEYSHTFLGTQFFYRNEIVFWSKNKKDCEMFLDANKYNL